MKLALLIEETSHVGVTMHSTTSTQFLFDDYLPADEHTPPRTAQRSVSAIHIRITAQ